MVKFIIKTSIFLITIILIAALVTAAAWSLWIMFITWIFNHPWDRQIMIATSVFWIINGGITWAILRLRKT